MAKVDVDTFEAQAAKYGILPIPFMGGTLYRRLDIEAAIEQAWLRSTNGARAGISTTRRPRRGSGALLVELPKPRRRKNSGATSAA